MPTPSLQNPQLQVSYMDELHSPRRPSAAPQNSTSSQALYQDATYSRDSSRHTAISQHPSGGQRYSIVETPIEMQQPMFPQNPPPMPSLPQSPTSPGPRNMSRHVYSEQPVHQTASYPQDKISSGPGSPASPYGFEPPSEPHPATFAPYIDNQAHHSPQSPGHTQWVQPRDNALPPLMTPSDSSNRQVSPRKDSFYQTPTHTAVEPQPFEPPPLKHVPTYNPDSSTGPNGLLPELHQPGQIVHPNMQLSDGRWKHGLCDCSSIATCCTGIFCPCILYGKSQYRLNRRSAKRDATDLLSYESINGMCGIFCLACGFQCILALLQHTRVRHAYKLEGSIVGDCGQAFCCTCCSLIQEELEVSYRESEARRNAGPASAIPYTAPGAMSYPPPP